MKPTNEALSQHQTKGNSDKSQKWKFGLGCKDRGCKSHVKMLVLDELEQRPGKQLKEAQGILSSIISELRCGHGLDEAAIWHHIPKAGWRQWIGFHSR